jgi:hypothetical protein
VTRVFRYSLSALGFALFLLASHFAFAEGKYPDYVTQGSWMRLSAASFEWSDQAGKAKPYAIKVCILGDSKISTEPALAKLYEIPPNPGIKLELMAIDSWKSASRSCKILFIDKSEENKLSEIIAGIKGSPILTISNIENFVSSGGMIEFIYEDTEVGTNQRYIISPRAIKSAGITIIDPKILEFAKEVR